MTPSPKPETAVIVDSGSTNRAGFRIEVSRSGAAEMTPMRPRFASSDETPKPLQRTVPSGVVKRFYGDLKAAGSLASLPRVHTMKSASFGSSLTVEFGNEQTPDLNSGDGGNAAVRDLIRDVNEIVALFQDT
jgi:hypothetical protein